jgi:hypothetical protein
MLTANSDRQACTGSSSYVYKKMMLSVVRALVTSNMPAKAERVLQLALCCVVVTARPGNHCRPFDIAACLFT